LTPGTQLSPDATVEAPAPSAGDTGRHSKKQSRIALLVMTPEFTLAIAVALVAIFLTVESSAFATWGNLKLIFTGASPTFFVCVAVTLLMVGGGIDLSVGSVAALCAVVTGKFLQSGIPIPISILIGLRALASRP
jgi:ribose transport system permease protein